MQLNCKDFQKYFFCSVRDVSHKCMLFLCLWKIFKFSENVHGKKITVIYFNQQNKTNCNLYNLFNCNAALEIDTCNKQTVSKISVSHSHS